MNVKEWPTILSFVLTGAIAALTYPRLPARVPVHWGVDGLPDRYGTPFEALFLLPLVLLGAAALLWLVQRSGPDRANAPVLRTARLGLGLLALLATLSRALDWETVRAVLIGVGLLFTLLGNVMGRAQPSVFVGLRTPWVFRSRRAWFASQRRSAVWLTGLGVVLAGVSAAAPLDWLFPWVVPVGLLTALVGMGAWLTYASYLDWKRDPSPEPALKS
ncbi:DUF1648 domain-containing protein [Deinococcus aerophilus]|uniref:DUF1648 domain-containing protein n=1 Tax=Deinococcus aerophilus TaxID=522488 RepID=A0ABQ2GR88_9DEIO|nr:DUF1648 domain-containing protein [Deinococcus aerophilus]GGM09148.1 hypothetical protein GCM10010841_16910 [Deinococcus aerophilus]